MPNRRTSPTPGDGKISPTELQLYYMMNGGSLSEEEIADIFKRADSDGDKEISAEELLEICSHSEVLCRELFTDEDHAASLA